jgi:hypothetical protein
MFPNLTAVTMQALPAAELRPLILTIIKVARSAAKRQMI